MDAVCLRECCQKLSHTADIRFKGHRIPRGVIRLYENTFFLVNITTLKIHCYENPSVNGSDTNTTDVQFLSVNKPLVIKTFDCHCENVVAEEYRLFIDLTYCNGSDDLSASMDIQFPVNLAYLTEYFDLEHCSIT